MQTNHRIIIGDSRNMTTVPDESVHLVITSPPYWQLKDYGSEEQIGYHDTYEDYINNLNLVWHECHRVLHAGCRLCVNIGDQFARTAYYGRYKVIPIRTEVIKFCETVGFDYMGAIIWQKVTTCNTTGGATIMGSFPYPRNGIVKIDYEFILIFKKTGTAPTASNEIKENSKMTTEEWNTYFSGHWNFPGEKQSGHIAMFPTELPRRLIRMFSFCGETVLDPFGGSGTTSLAAAGLDRNSIMYEINSNYIPTIREKLAVGENQLFDEKTFTFETDEADQSAIDNKMVSLPYRFEDKVKLNSKVRQRKHSYGSVISENEEKHIEYFSIASIISPEVVVLSDGRKIRLTGVKTIPDREDAAMEFLMNITKGEKLFVKIDPTAKSGKDEISGYLYLKNKTFINAHLIKKGVVVPDTENNYLLKDKFTAQNSGELYA